MRAPRSPTCLYLSGGLAGVPQVLTVKRPPLFVLSLCSRLIHALPLFFLCSQNESNNQLYQSYYYLKILPNFKSILFTRLWVVLYFFIGGGLSPACRLGLSPLTMCLPIMISIMPMIKSINALIVRSRHSIGFFFCFLFLTHCAVSPFQWLCLLFVLISFP